MGFPLSITLFSHGVPQCPLESDFWIVPMILEDCKTFHYIMIKGVLRPLTTSQLRSHSLPPFFVRQRESQHPCSCIPTYQPCMANGQNAPSYINLEKPFKSH